MMIMVIMIIKSFKQKPIDCKLQTANSFLAFSRIVNLYHRRIFFHLRNRKHKIMETQEKTESLAERKIISGNTSTKDEIQIKK